MLSFVECVLLVLNLLSLHYISLQSCAHLVIFILFQKLCCAAEMHTKENCISCNHNTKMSKIHLTLYRPCFKFSSSGSRFKAFSYASLASGYSSRPKCADANLAQPFTHLGLSLMALLASLRDSSYFFNCENAAERLLKYTSFLQFRIPHTNQLVLNEGTKH